MLARTLQAADDAGSPEEYRSDEAIIRAIYQDIFGQGSSEASDFKTFYVAALRVVAAIRQRDAQTSGDPVPLTEADLVNRAEARRLLQETHRVMDEVEQMIAAF